MYEVMFADLKVWKEIWELCLIKTVLERDLVIYGRGTVFLRPSAGIFSALWLSTFPLHVQSAITE